MGVWDAVSSFVDTVVPWSTAYAEAPTEEDKKEETATESKTETAEEPAKAEEAADEPEEEAEKEGEEEEEEEEEETVDPKEKFEEACRNSPQCAPSKHHFDECVERVTGGKGDDPEEDCVEEFFHLAHCASQCAAPKLWRVLK